MKKFYFILILFITIVCNAGEIKVPSPVKDEIRIDMATWIQVYDIQGRLVAQGKERKLDVRHLATGMYFVVTDAGKCTIIKE